MGEGVWDRLRQLEEEASKKGVRLGAVSGLDFAIMHSCMRCLIAFARVLAQSAGEVAKNSVSVYIFAFIGGVSAPPHSLSYSLFSRFLFCSVC